MASGARHLADNEPGFVLHTYPYRETSLLVETFTLGHGRVPMVARGARRPHSQLRGQLLPFQPLTLSWSGKSEVKTLVRAEWQGGQPLLEGLALMCGFYLNELLLRLLQREDPHETLFQTYRQTLQELAAGDRLAGMLRRFETRLLRELGYALVLEREAESAAPVDPRRLYNYAFERGPVPAGADAGEGALLGKTLLDMAAEHYEDPLTRQQSKALMRMLISHHLGGQPLHTPQLLKDLQEL